MLEGAGGNIAVLTGPSGHLLVDVGIAASQDKIRRRLVELGGGPLRYVINTHWHWDHAEGNSWARRAGAEVIAHPHAIGRFRSTVRVEEWGHTFEPVPPQDRPTNAVATSRTIPMDGERIRIRAYGPGHTDGDLAVYFERADILVTGDTFWNGQYPFIDYVGGGSIDAAIRQTDRNIAMASEQTLIIPGHGPVARRANLVEFRAMLAAVRARVAELKARGLSLEEVVAENPTRAFDGKFGTGIVTPALFTALVYRGL
jgi:glyoxylase-like metal-dependent hydrolase (beta-lactamase superfamily II)